MNRLTIAILLGLSLSACSNSNMQSPLLDATLGAAATAISGATGVNVSADSLKTVAGAVSKTFEDISPEQEYFLGRSVSANLLKQYPSQERPQANRYLNLLGKTLVLSTDKADDFENYHFLILDSDEINAFAAPSGFIFVTKGMLKLCENEEDLAAVLAHEISHVQLSHALQAIEAGRITSVFTTIGQEAAKTFAPAELTQLTQVFSASVADMVKTLTSSGYSRDLELEADKNAVTILQNSGYNPYSLITILKRLKAHTKPNANDFTSTHPDNDERIAQVSQLLQGIKPPSTPSIRVTRFARELSQL